jgi:argininosuccinate lyase
MFPGILFHTGRMRETAGDAFSTATDIAEYLVKKGVPFRSAHEITGKIVLHCIKKKKRLDELTLRELRDFSTLISKDIYSFLKPEESVRNKKSLGCTSLDDVTRQIRRLRKTVGSGKPGSMKYQKVPGESYP